ncbi:PadR family transcriptional regulator [Paenibacillus sp. GD4]|jgi:DNA-binding PadR family transcriptional regulator|uniref:PadR family transcriptional regulator n=1 Tax=Paenibacillus TaxID=44249 RepID=UPI002543CD97|nr:MULTISPECIES: PadR family transcriptional regulator [Paenibacillus]MDQ1912155.1 PadR family transcriptional regulator [Paenibacillus sp. GD4]
MSMKLVILGLLMEGNSHPYEMRQRMKERAMLHYVKMQEGSLYYAIEQLHKDGSVAIVETVSTGGRPDRTIYTITEKGKAIFQELLLEKFATEEKVYHPMYAALAFARYADPERVQDILQAKVEKQREHVRHMRSVYEERKTFVPRGSMHVMIGFCEHAETELRWMERLLRDVQAGRLKERGVPLEL